MKNGLDVMKEKGMIPDSEGNYSEDEFNRVGLPMVVSCRKCVMTMSLPSATIIGDRWFYCSECAEQWEESQKEKKKCEWCEADGRERKNAPFLCELCYAEFLGMD